MKTRLTRFAATVIGLLGSLSLVVFNAPADVGVSVGVQINATAEFYAPLTPHGAWVEVGTYGRCWRPAGVAVEWRPYGYGSWVWTDCGWYWVSDEPWAWACYHYGSWVHDSFHGWVWIPGLEWAPAWVSWRIGGAYCGWAPLPPRGVIVAPSLFVFVESHRFHEPVRPGTLVVNNTTVINQTREITSIKRESRTFDGSGPKKVVINEGPGLDAIQKASGRKISAIPVREADRRTTVPAGISRDGGEANRKEKPPVQHEQPGPGAERKPSAPGGERKDPGPGNERKQPPGDLPTPPAKPAPPDKDRPHPRDDVSPSPRPPSAPSAPGAPPGKTPSAPKGKGEGRGHGKDKP